MLRDIVEAEPLDQLRLRIRFDDGVEGVVDVGTLLPLTGVFAPLADHPYFSQVRVNPELGTLCWPNGADLDPQKLYSVVTGSPLPGESVTDSEIFSQQLLPR